MLKNKKIIVLSIFIINFSYTFSEDIEEQYNYIKEIPLLNENSEELYDFNSNKEKNKNNELSSDIENKSNEISENKKEFLDISNIKQSEKNIMKSSKKIDKVSNFKEEINDYFKKEERFQKINERTNTVAALGSAMGAIDLGSTPAKKVRVGAGIGNTSDSQAFAVGIGYAPTDRFKINTKFSSSSNDFNNNSISFGASYDLDF